MSTATSQLTLTGPAALRSLAQAFTHFSEFDRFVQGLQAALGQSEQFGRLTLRVDRGLVEGAGRFPGGTLALPLAGGDGQIGLLQVAPVDGPRQFGPEDLHLLSGLADFLSVALLQSLRLEAADKAPGLLRFLLNQAPIGIAAYGPDNRLIVANDLANRWLGEPGAPAAPLQRNTGSFHLRASGKLIFGEARQTGPETGGVWFVVLQDLTGEQARLLELVKRETYRALAENRRVGFAFVESAQIQDGVLRRLPDLRAALLAGELAGPYDATRVGVIFPGLDGLALRGRLRRLRAVFGDAAGLRLGYAELGRDGRTPEVLLAAALQRPGPFAEVLRPVLLVHDDNPGVADTLAMVLGKEFRVVKSSRPERTRELLAKEVFDGLVTELESRNGGGGIELARYAREQRPGIRPFFTTVQRPPYGLPAGAADPEVVMLEKPFDVEVLTRKVRARLLEA